MGDFESLRQDLNPNYKLFERSTYIFNFFKVIIGDKLIVKKTHSINKNLKPHLTKNCPIIFLTIACLIKFSSLPYKIKKLKTQRKWKPNINKNLTDIQATAKEENLPKIKNKEKTEQFRCDIELNLLFNFFYCLLLHKRQLPSNFQVIFSKFSNVFIGLQVFRIFYACVN